MAADCDLLFGLVALQVGLIDQGQLVVAFQAWARDKARALAEHLTDRGDLDSEQRAAVEAIVAVHLRKHGDDVERSLAAVPAGKSIRESLANIGDPDIEATLGHVRLSHGLTEDADRTPSCAFGRATSDGQRFRVLRLHSRGGLGAVFVALDAELNREVALKQILDSHVDDSASRGRFLLEAEITGGLEHPGIVPVYGLGTDAKGRPYYAMRFVRGETLKEAIGHFHGDETLLKDPGRRSLALRQLLRRFMDVCNAIGYAHSRGVLHRDIKPGNVIVGKHGETLVVDWGLAKATGKSDPSAGEQTLVPGSASGVSETLPGSALGTPAYMSPEQARGELDRVGPSSEVYSLGATLYCLLTGKPPLEGEAAEALRAAQSGAFLPPRRVDPTIDQALEAVCLKAMALWPADRYATPKELAEDIERWMADERVTAWREPFSRTARRWGRRNRTAVAAAVAAVVMALAGTAAVLAVQTKANYDLKAANNDLASANAHVKKSNIDLEAANRREHERFDLAMAAIKLFHGEVSEDLLLKEKQFEGLRTKLLRGAANFYSRLDGLLQGQTDPKSRTSLGNAYEELAELTGKIGSKPEALAVHLKALAVRRELAGLAPADAESESASRAASLNVARSLIAVGLLREETGDLSGAMVSYEEARELADWPNAGAAVRSVLGTSYHRIGRLLFSMGKPALAMAAYEHARSIRQTLADSDPAASEYQRDLAGSLMNIGLLLAQTGRPTESLLTLEQARAIGQKLADANPAVTQFQRDLATTYTSIGYALRQAVREAEALRALEKGRVIQQRLADSNPSVTLFQSDLARIHSNISNMYSLAGREAESQVAAEKALAIRQALAEANPNAILYQLDFALSLSAFGVIRQNQGHADLAAKAYRKTIAIMERLPTLRTVDLFNIGSIYGRLAELAASPGSGVSVEEAQAEADRAMTWLRKAVDRGYRPKIALLRAAIRFNALWSRTDFQQLFLDRAMPDNPFAP